jgi:HD superfamily phosphodiesterase
MYKTYKQFITEDLFFNPFGDHGVGHTRRVLYLAHKLADKYDLTPKDKIILAIACCYHDIGRTNDLTDDEHGAESANKVLRLELNKKHHLSDEESQRVLDLITFHSLDDELWKKTDKDLVLYQILKDADALDRLRFNDLNRKYLRLPESHNMLSLEFSLLRADGIIK